MESYYPLPLLSGAYVIGTTSTEEKAAKAKACGADEVILYSKKDFVQEVNSLTHGGGVNVVYDGVGKATFDKGKYDTLFFLYKNIFYKNIEAEICEMLRIL